MNYSDLKNYIISDQIDSILKTMTCLDDVSSEKNRYLNLLEEAFNTFGDGDYHFISSPGRSEVGGNHTDHQHGHVLACGVNIDDVVVFKANNTNICNYAYKNKIIKVDVDDLEIHEEQYNTSESLIRGVAARLNQLGYKIGGFDAVCDAQVFSGSGISSSACFEVMLVEMFNSLFNEEKVSPVDRAIIGQYAENVYFGKPSGLMDQMAISVGSFIGIDFKDPNKPVIENYEFSFADYGYEFALINAKGDHADLSHEYAAIPNEIKEVSKQLGVEYLADSTMEEFMKKLPEIRKTIKNDRAILRAFHFYNEDKRAVQEKEAVKNKDINELLRLMNESGRSSYEYLQNVYPASLTYNQPIAVALALADQYLKDDGAYRVHGGGFGGTIQCIVPKDKMEGFSKVMKDAFGEDSILIAKVRPFGTKTVI